MKSSRGVFRTRADNSMMNGTISPNTISMMKKINPDAFDVNTYIPLPGTKLYDEMPENTKMQIDYLKYSNKCPRPFVFDINKQDDCIRLTRKIIRLADRVMLKTIIKK